MLNHPIKAGIAQTQAVLHGLSWPVWAAVGACVWGLVMLGASTYLQKQTLRLQGATRSIQIQNDRSLAAPSVATGLDPEKAVVFPFDATHVDDLRRVFRLAKENGFVVGAIEYRAEPNPQLPIVVRSLSFRMNEDYPRLKAFTADMLGSMRHASLQEIRIERKDALAVQAQAQLKFAFVYRTDTGPAKLAN